MAGSRQPVRTIDLAVSLDARNSSAYRATAHLIAQTLCVGYCTGRQLRQTTTVNAVICRLYRMSCPHPSSELASLSINPQSHRQTPSSMRQRHWRAPGEQPRLRLDPRPQRNLRHQLQVLRQPAPVQRQSVAPFQTQSLLRDLNLKLLRALGAQLSDMILRATRSTSRQRLVESPSKTSAEQVLGFATFLNLVEQCNFELLCLVCVLSLCLHLLASHDAA